MSIVDSSPQRCQNSLIMIEGRCEVLLIQKTIDYGSTRFVNSESGERIDLGPNTPERQAVVEMTIKCEFCNIFKQLRAEGRPPSYGADFEAVSKTREFLRENCAVERESNERKKSWFFN